MGKSVAGPAFRVVAKEMPELCPTRLSGRWRHAADPHHGGDADRDRADDGEDRLPDRGGHGHLGNAVGDTIAGDDGRGGIKGDDQKPRPGPRHEGQEQLPDAERRSGGNESDGDGTQGTGAGMICPDAGIDPRDGRQGEDGQGEQQPAEEPDGGQDHEGAEKEHGGVSVR